MAYDEDYDDEPGYGHNSGEVSADERLRQYIERWERLDEEAKGIADDKKDVMLEAKAAGYDTKTLRALIRRRKMKPEDREEQDALLDVYEAALGM